MSLNASAQGISNRIVSSADTLLKPSVFIPQRKQITDTLEKKPFLPDVRKSLWMGIIIPGYGQILNRKYWKLPIVYGGFLGFAYAISWNGGKYQSYQTAYRDITDNDLTTNSFMNFLPIGRTIEDYGGVVKYTQRLKTFQDNFRRYRDLSVICTVAFYAITLVDAYVDAQLYDFDISPNISLRVQPTLLKNTFGVPNTLGMQCSFSLK
jgi:hypothetical protein